MPSRAVVWTLAILAVILIVVPLLSMAGMMTCRVGMMGGNMRACRLSGSSGCCSRRRS